MKNLLPYVALLTTLATGAAANDFTPAMENYLEANIREWASDPILIDAINAQNAVTNAYTQTEIDDLDQQWRGYVGNFESDLIKGVIENPAAEFLRDHVAMSGGAITEVFIMDAQGLNVAASTPTSDYWQGDEDKFQQTYLIGPGTSHMGEVEYDESTGAVQSQISMTITDSATGAAIGAITVGIDLIALQ